jgi:hypothetical protein
MWIFSVLHLKEETWKPGNLGIRRQYHKQIYPGVEYSVTMHLWT